MRASTSEGININKAGVTTSGTKLVSSYRTLTAAQSNNSDWFRLIEFTLPSTSFPQFALYIIYDWTIYPDDGSSKRATWSGKNSIGGYVYFGSSSDRGWIGDSFYRKVWWEGNYFGDAGWFNDNGNGKCGIQMKSALSRQSVVTCSAEIHCNRWDLLTITYYT